MVAETTQYGIKPGGRTANGIVFATLILTLACLQASCAQSDRAPQIVYKGDIVFSDDLLMSTIDQVVREPNGNLYVVDRTGQSVYYFDPSGNLIHSLSIETCDPGRTFTPHWVSTNGEDVFVINGGPWGYRFDSAGKCLGQVSENYYPLQRQVTVGDRIIGLRRNARPEIPLVITKANLTGETIATTPIPIGDFPVANRRVETGGLAETEWATYYVPSITPTIYRVDLQGNLSSIDVGREFDHKQPTEDLPAGRAGPEFFSAFAKRLRFATANQGLFDAGDDLLVAQFLTVPNRWDRLWLYAKDGTVAWAETDTLGFTYISDGHAFRVKQPDYRDDGSMPNPYLEAYEITR